MILIGKNIIGFLALVALASCMGDDNKNLEYQGPDGSYSSAPPSSGDGTPDPDLPDYDPDDPYADPPDTSAGSGSTADPGGAATLEEIADQTGIQLAKLEAYEPYIGGWDGLDDEIPSGLTWGLSKPAPGDVGADAGASASAGAGTATPPPSSGQTGQGSVAYLPTIKGILDSKCVSCHNPNGSRPQSPLDTYANAKQFGASVVARVNDNSMPPPAVGTMTPAEKTSVNQWAPAFLENAGANGSTETPGSGTNPQVTEGANGEVIFAIKAGTGNGDWNTKDQELVLKVGQVLVLKNDDSMVHILHTNGAPCGHGSEFGPGETYRCNLQQPFSGTPTLYDHNTDGANKFYLRVEQ